MMTRKEVSLFDQATQRLLNFIHYSAGDCDIGHLGR
uniref:Uncharacterized protein n=1 Tax=Anguilla anguilla TaxID=7936 RepID=A0A0E9VVD8_ANGAN